MVPKAGSTKGGLCLLILSLCLQVQGWDQDAVRAEGSRYFIHLREQIRIAATDPLELDPSSARIHTERAKHIGVKLTEAYVDSHWGVVAWTKVRHIERPAFQVYSEYNQLCNAIVPDEGCTLFGGVVSENVRIPGEAAFLKVLVLIIGERHLTPTALDSLAFLRTALGNAWVHCVAETSTVRSQSRLTALGACLSTTFLTGPARDHHSPRGLILFAEGRAGQYLEEGGVVNLTLPIDGGVDTSLIVLPRI